MHLTDTTPLHAQSNLLHASITSSLDNGLDHDQEAPSVLRALTEPEGLGRRRRLLDETTTGICGSGTETETANATETVIAIEAMSVIAMEVAGVVLRVLTLLGIATGSNVTAIGIETAMNEGSEKTDTATTEIATTCDPLVRPLILVIAVDALLLPGHDAVTIDRQSLVPVRQHSHRAVRPDQDQLPVLRPPPNRMPLCRRRKTTPPT